MKRILLLLLCLFALTSTCQTFAQSRIYLRTNTCGAFWNSNGNEKAMNAVFGADNWQYQYFETVSLATLLADDIDFIFIEGSNCGTEEMTAFLDANRAAIENWVSEGGNLLINAAPTEGLDIIDIGFGDIQITWIESGSYGDFGTAADPSHPMFTGPALPTGNVWSGSAFAHYQVLGTGLSGLIKDTHSSELYLAEKNWGEGSVVVGGLTLSIFQEEFIGWSPIQEVSNIHKNLLTYMARGRKNAQIIVPAEANPFEEVVQPFIAIEALATTALCQGAEVAVPFAATGDFDAANIFTVQLSDASGNFDSFTTLAAAAGTGSGEIKVTVPANTLAGTAYRIRVVASHPEVASDGYFIAINPLPAPAITVTPAQNPYTGGTANTVLLGYGPQQITLLASNAAATVSTNYEWSTANGLEVTGASAVFKPVTAGAYTFTVTATSDSGCEGAASVTISVVDARCGNKNDKVLVCHKGQEICIAPSAVQVHLDHGCFVGSCISTAVVAASSASKATALQEETSALVAYPNPFNETATVGFTLKATGYYRLELLDVKGTLVTAIAAGEDVAGATHSYQLGNGKMLEGIYIIRFVTAGEVKTTKIIYKK